MSRVIETPNAVMTTYASPSQGSETLSLWRVEMAAGAQGPVHVVDSEQIWTLLTGTARIELGDQTLTLEDGDTVVLPAGTVRQVVAVADLTALVVGFGAAQVSVPGETEGRGTPPWIA